MCHVRPGLRGSLDTVRSVGLGQRHDPPDGFRDFLTTLYELSSCSRVQAFGFCQDVDRRDTLVPIAASDWRRLCFDSDRERLRSADLFLDRRRAWTSVRFSKADLVREWPAAGAAAFATELADRYWRERFQARSDRSVRERRRRACINRFVEKQRRLRHWISFVEIADTCARAVGPASIAEEDEARSLAYRRLVELISRGEFEKTGKSWILMLIPKLDGSAPPHRLSYDYFRGMVDAYGVTDFTSNSGLVRDHLWFCWLPSELCREWFERHLLAWPSEFNPKDQTLGARPQSPENNPDVEISEPPVPDAVVPEKGQPGRKPGSGSFDDDEVLLEMLRLLANGKAKSVHAAARRVVASGIAKNTGTGESAVRRLRRKYAAKFGTDPLPGKTWNDIAREMEMN